jgi:hypothetical protein
MNPMIANGLLVYPGCSSGTGDTNGAMRLSIASAF